MMDGCLDGIVMMSLDFWVSGDFSWVARGVWLFDVDTSFWFWVVCKDIIYITVH